MSNPHDTRYVGISILKYNMINYKLYNYNYKTIVFNVFFNFIAQCVISTNYLFN